MTIRYSVSSVVFFCVLKLAPNANMQNGARSELLQQNSTFFKVFLDAIFPLPSESIPPFLPMTLSELQLNL
jgi:hypothetical protein